eukprot:1660692-Rhodomonas_salina.1
MPVGALVLLRACHHTSSLTVASQGSYLSLALLPPLPTLPKFFFTSCPLNDNSLALSPHSTFGCRPRRV